MALTHYDGCNPHYAERGPGKPYPWLHEEGLDGRILRTCMDCGAYEWVDEPEPDDTPTTTEAEEAENVYPPARDCDEDDFFED